MIEISRPIVEVAREIGAHERPTAPPMMWLGIFRRLGPQVILTSTQQSVRSLGQAVPVEVYTSDEAVGFLREATGLDDDAGAGQLVLEPGWLPLALRKPRRSSAPAITYPECVRLIRDYPLPRYLIHQLGQHYPHGSAEADRLPARSAGYDGSANVFFVPLGRGRKAVVIALGSPDSPSQQQIRMSRGPVCPAR